MRIEPCPFCGLVPDIEHASTFRKIFGFGALYCPQCECRGPLIGTKQRDWCDWRWDAVKKWNERK